MNVQLVCRHFGQSQDHSSAQFKHQFTRQSMQCPQNCTNAVFWVSWRYERQLQCNEESTPQFRGIIETKLHVYVTTPASSLRFRNKNKLFHYLFDNFNNLIVNKDFHTFGGLNKYLKLKKKVKLTHFQGFPQNALVVGIGTWNSRSRQRLESESLING